MTRNRLDPLERFAPLFETSVPSFDSFLRRRDRKHLNQRVAAGVVAIAIVAVPVAWIIATGGRSGRTPVPGDTGSSVAVPGGLSVDYVIDLNTGVMTPLPDSILRTLGKVPERSWSQYVVSPDGTLIAYVGTGDDGTPQIFTAAIEGTAVRQMTRDAIDVNWPALSPDSRKIAYASGTSLGGAKLFVFDVVTGRSTQITEEIDFGGGLQFTPDGSALLYTGCIGTCSIGHAEELRTVPVTGGSSTVLIGPGGSARGDLTNVMSGALSPDGSHVTFIGSEVGSPELGRWVANVDGTQRRSLPGCVDSIPAGTWSPDGSRIVCLVGFRDRAIIVVVDVATGDFSEVAEGRTAIWLDDHTLLVEV